VHSTSLKQQLGKLQSHFCGSGLCGDPSGEGHQREFRLPCCAAFLRPTDRLQSPNARLISSGLHIPVCAVLRNAQKTRRGGDVLRRKFFRREAVTHKVFEELFNTGILGSRWLTYEELEKFYRASSVLMPEDTILLHAQELPIGA
jgi:hypothetical protein